MRADKQVTCFVQVEGAGIKYMQMYDQFPAHARQALRDAPFNLCAACAACAAIEDIEDIDRWVKNACAEIRRLECTPPADPLADQ